MVFRHARTPIRTPTTCSRASLKFALDSSEPAAEAVGYGLHLKSFYFKIFRGNSTSRFFIDYCLYIYLINIISL